jgi:hypothetical protein
MGTRRQIPRRSGGLAVKTKLLGAVAALAGWSFCMPEAARAATYSWTWEGSITGAGLLMTGPGAGSGHHQNEFMIFRPSTAG